MTSRKPRWTLDDTLRRAESAERLVTEHGPALSDRIEADTGDKLNDGIDRLRAVSKGIPLTNQKTATARERELAKDAHDLVMLFRELVQRSPHASADLRTAMGVGESLNPAVTKRVLDALAAVAANASALRACGAGQADIDEAARLATELSEADRTQSVSMQARASATDSHAALLLEVQDLVERIAMAGKFAFRKNRLVRERFEALLTPPGSSRGGKPAGGGSGVPAAADQGEQSEEGESST